MKIIALTAENIKKLVAVEIRPDGNLVAAGYIASPATSWDIWVRKYTP